MSVGILQYWRPPWGQYNDWNVANLNLCTFRKSFRTLTEMSTRNLPREQKRPVPRADNLITFMWRLSWNPDSFNFLGPCVPFQACSGKALPLYVEITQMSRLFQVVYTPLQVSACYWPPPSRLYSTTKEKIILRRGPSIRSVLCNIKQCSLVKVYRRFRRICCLHR